MELHMKEESKVMDIQKEFSQAYPFLKMDFFKSVKDRLRWTAGMVKLLPEESLNNYFRTDAIRLVNIQFDKTVMQVKNEIEDLLFLKVVVLRKSGNVWIETSLTTGWTLEQQNREGSFLN
jgi:hypothetical protein